MAQPDEENMCTIKEWHARSESAFALSLPKLLSMWPRQVLILAEQQRRSSSPLSVSVVHTGTGMEPYVVAVKFSQIFAFSDHPGTRNVGSFGSPDESPEEWYRQGKLVTGRDPIGGLAKYVHLAIHPYQPLH